MISTERYEATIGPFDAASPAISTIEYVIHYAGDQWSSPDTRITLSPCVVDAGVTDASVSDAGVIDASVSDVTASDVAVKDVGVVDEVPTAAPASDCGCRSGPTSRAPWGALAMLARNRLRSETLAAISVFWYFVAGIWPFLYYELYL